jgi:hypothetical protein
MSANTMQAECIKRYHAHLLKRGEVVTLEDAARTWVGKYARMWRLHYTTRAVTVI